MLKTGMPQDLEEIIQFMELQESAEKSSMAKAKAQNSSQNGGNRAGSNKGKGNSGQNGGSSKKAKKHCELCEKHGGPATPITPMIAASTRRMVVRRDSLVRVLAAITMLYDDEGR